MPETFAYDGPAELERPIVAALSAVVDPEVALNIVDVGLVQSVAVTPERLHVKMTMTSAACPVTDVILGDVERELDRVAPPEMTIAVELVWEPAWTPERMSERAKRFMKW